MIESVAHVDLRWPNEGEAPPAVSSTRSGLPTLADIESAFAEWVAEARRRGCPADAPVLARQHEHAPFGLPDLRVVWDASAPRVFS